MILNFSSGATLGAIIDIISQQASPPLYRPTLKPQQDDCGRCFAVGHESPRTAPKSMLSQCATQDDKRQTEPQPCGASHSPSPTHVGNYTTTAHKIKSTESHITLTSRLPRLDSSVSFAISQRFTHGQSDPSGETGANADRKLLLLQARGRRRPLQTELDAHSPES